MAELNGSKEAWQAERDSIHQLELQSLLTELELEREKHSSAAYDLERKFEEKLAAVKKQLEQDREAELAELDQQRQTDIAEIKATMEQQLADREMELSDELHSITSDAANLRREVGDLTLSKSKAASEYELHIAALKQKLDLKSQQHDQEVSDLQSKHWHEVDALKANLGTLQIEHEKAQISLAERHSHEIEMVGNSEQSRLNSVCTKFHGQVTHLSDRVGWLRGEVADVLRRSAVDLKNDVTVIEREMQQLHRLHSSSVSQLSSKYDDDVNHYKKQVHALQQEQQQMAADHQVEMSRLRQHIEQSLTTQHQSVVADLTDRHTAEMNRLQLEVDRLREKCSSLSSEVIHYQHELKRRGDDIALLKERHSSELQALNEQHDRELTDLEKQKDGELLQSNASLERKHADDISSAEASHKEREAELMEQIEKLRFDYGQTVSDVNEEKQKEISALEEEVVALQKKNESVSVQLEFKTEEIAHLQGQLDVLGQEHSRILQEVESSSNELLKWQQLADKLKADNTALLEKSAEEVDNLQAEVKMLQSAKGCMMEEHARHHEEEVARYRMEIDAAVKAHAGEVSCLNNNMKSLEEQLSQATSNHRLQVEELKQNHHEEKVTLENSISSLQDDVQELKAALTEKETSSVDLQLLNEANTLLRSETKDLREHLDQNRLKLQEEAGERVKLQAVKDALDEELSVAENQLQVITDEKERLENQCAVLTDKCKELEAEIEELQSTGREIEKCFLWRDKEKQLTNSQMFSSQSPEVAEEKPMVQHVQDLIQENTLLLSQNSDLNDNNNLLQNQWSSLKHEHEFVVDELNSVRRDKDSLNEELQLGKEQSAALAIELEGLRKELQETKELESLRKELQETKEQVQSKVEQEMVLKSRLQTMEGELEETKQRCSSLTGDLKAAQEGESLVNFSVRDLTQLLKERTSEVDVLCNELKSTKDQCELFESQLEAEKKERQLLAATCESLETELEKSRSESEQMKIQVQGLLQSSALLESKLQSATDQISATELEKQDLIEQKNSVESHLNDTKDLVSSLQSELVLAKEVIQPLQKQLVSGTEEIDTFRGQLQDLENVIKVLEEDKQHLEMRLETASAESCAVAERLKELETSNVSLNTLLHESRELCSDLTLSCDQYQSQISMLTLSNEQTTQMVSEWQERNKILSEENESLRRQKLQTEELLGAAKDIQYMVPSLTARVDELEDKCQLQTQQLEEVEEQSQKLRAKLSESEESNNQYSDQLQALNNQNNLLVDEVKNEKSKFISMEAQLAEKLDLLESLSCQINELDTNQKQSLIRLGDMQEENEVLKARAATASEAVEKLELHVSELTKEKESLSMQLESLLERQKVFQEQDGIAQAELRVLRRQVCTLSKLNVAVARTDAEADHKGTSEEKERDTKEELQDPQKQVTEMAVQSNTINQQDNTSEKLQVLEAQLSAAGTALLEGGDGTDAAEFLLNDNIMLQQKVASLQQLCDKQQEELEVARRKMAWLRKSRLVTFTDELKQSESAEGDPVVPVDTAYEKSEDGKKLKCINDCQAAQLANAEALLEEKVELLVQAQERCANVEADHDEVASRYMCLMEKHKTLLKELQHRQAELANEQSRAVEREQLLRESQTELVAVREKLQQITTSYDEIYQKRQAEEKSVVDTQAELLSKTYLLNEAEARLSQLQDISWVVANAGISSHEELIVDLRAQLSAEKERVSEADKSLAEKDKLLQESKTRLKMLEDKCQKLKQQHESSLSTVDERVSAQVNEMKRKCIAKVKSIQAEYDAKLSDSATALSVTKSARDARVNELEKVVREKEGEIEMLESRLHIVETDLENRTSDIQLKLDRSRERLTELESTLADTDKRQKDELDAQADKLNRENGERLADLKRRAETRLGQIKRQLQSDKESAVNELNHMADELRARLAACEDELYDAVELGKDAQNKNSKIAQLTESLIDVRELLQKRKSEMTEKESVIDHYRSELENLEKKLQNSVQEIDVLTGSLKESELSQTDLKQQLSATEQERQKLAERCEVEVRTAALDNEQELDRLKAEFDEKQRDTENEHNAQIKQLVKEFRLQMAQKEKEFQSNYSEVLGMFFIIKQ